MKQLNELIQKLKSIDLSNIDLSKIDTKSIQASLVRRKDILIDLILIVVTIFVVQSLLKTNESRTKTLNQELAQLEEKKKSVTAFEKTQTDFDALKKTIPIGFETETEIIRTVLNLAQAQGVKVLDYTPTASLADEYSSVQNVNFIFESSYPQILKFMQSIEKNEENLFITSWASNAKEVYDKKITTEPAVDENIIQWKVTIGSTLLLENEK